MVDKQEEQAWRWCLVGSIINSHPYGESKEILNGTKQFQPGAKVFIAPANWGDGYENVIVIGCPRHRKQYIEVIMRADYIENFRIKKVYAPFILRMMENSKYSWWNNTDYDKQRIQELIESFSEYRSSQHSDHE